MKKARSNRFWAITLGLVLAAALAAYFLLLGTGGPAATARIYQDGVLIEEIDLLYITAPYELTFDGPHGGNTVRLEPGRVCIIDAGCPDKTCVAHGWVTAPRFPAVCLPNRLVVEVSKGEDPGFDALSQ